MCPWQEPINPAADPDRSARIDLRAYDANQSISMRSGLMRVSVPIWQIGLTRSQEVTDLSGLFSPFPMRGVTLANRIIMPAMGLAVCEDGAPNAEHAAYYARRAHGGAGLVMTEGVYIDHASSGDN